MFSISNARSSVSIVVDNAAGPPTSFIVVGSSLIIAAAISGDRWFGSVNSTVPFTCAAAAPALSASAKLVPVAR